MAPYAAGMNANMFTRAHGAAPFWALFLYGSSADGGAGIFARVLARRSLAELGEFALEIYCLQGQPLISHSSVSHQSVISHSSVTHQSVISQSSVSHQSVITNNK